MIKKLVHGFLFGLGFSLSVLLVMWVIGHINCQSRREAALPSIESGSTDFAEQIRWQEMSMEEKLGKLSLVAVLRFKEKENGLMAAYVDRVVAIDESASIPLAVGDRVESSDYYSRENDASNRDGILLMYAGDPPREMEGAYLYDSRLVSYGDMPLDVFLKKLDAAKSK